MRASCFDRIQGRFGEAFDVGNPAASYRYSNLLSRQNTWHYTAAFELIWQAPSKGFPR